MPHSIQIIATILFALAILHTFCIKRLQHLALKFREGSVGENFFHLIGQVELVFGLWASLLVLTMTLIVGTSEAIHYVESLRFTEPAFVFVIMAVTGTRPIIVSTTRILTLVASVLPIQKSLSFYITTLIAGPLLGSFITEPAAMTVIALIIKNIFFEQTTSIRFKYLTLAFLFVNVSVGGVLTHFAAPPILMVANVWNWGTPYMFTHFGWKAIVAVFANSILLAVLLRKELREITLRNPNTRERRVPLWLTSLHVIFLIGIIFTAHHPIVFLGLFLLFQGITFVTQEYQDELKLKESFMVGLFLAGLVVLGGLQDWWLRPLLSSLSDLPLFLGATLLTAFLDNAALTYLGAQVPNLSENLKYALVAGAIAGGGLTLIANAPNPVGYAILRPSFGPEGISPLILFFYATGPTLIVMACLWMLAGI